MIIEWLSTTIAMATHTKQAINDINERLRGLQCAAKYPSEQVQAEEEHDEQKDCLSSLFQPIKPFYRMYK